MANEDGILVEIMRLERNVHNDLEETSKEFLFSSSIDNVSFTITCMICLFHSCQCLPIKPQTWCKVIKILWNQWSSTFRVGLGFEIRVGPRVRFKPKYLNKGQG
jgi:hypothetical protein